MWERWDPEHCWRERKMGQLPWKTVRLFLKKSEIELPYDPADLLLGVYPKELKVVFQTDICIYLVTAALSVIAKGGRDPNVHWWMNGQSAVYTYNGILFSQKKEWNYDTCNNMEGPWKHYAKLNTPGTKGQLLRDSIYWFYSYSTRIGICIVKKEEE